MAYFRKKPVVIEAEQFDRDKQHRMSAQFRAVICWESAHVGAVQRTPHIHTLEGSHLISDEDWIIKGVAGEFYPCKPEIFEATYERAEVTA